MNESTIIDQPLTLEFLARRMAVLEERLEDLEDLRELNAAIERNGNKPAMPWEAVKSELELDAAD